MMKSVRPLSLDWVPPELLVRDRQLHILLDNAALEIPDHYYAEGGKGTGKSLTARFFVGEVEARGLGRAYIIRCGTSMRRALKDFSMRHLKKPTSIFRPIGIHEIIDPLIEKDRPQKLFLIFDDIQNVYRSWVFNDVLQEMWETLQGMIDFSFILISQCPFTRFKKTLTGSVTSRLQLHPLMFGAYKTKELQQILRQRLRFALHEMKKEYDTPIMIIANRVEDAAGGDCRVAIETLRDAVLRGNGTLTLKSTNGALERVDLEFWKELLLRLPRYYALFLFLFAKKTKIYQLPKLSKAESFEIKKNENLPIPFNDVKKLFRLKCKEIGAEDRSDPMLYHIADVLCIEHRLLDKFVISKVHPYNPTKKRAFVIKLLVPPKPIVEAGETLNWPEMFGGHDVNSTKEKPAASDPESLRKQTTIG